MCHTDIFFFHFYVCFPFLASLESVSIDKDIKHGVHNTNIPNCTSILIPSHHSPFSDPLNMHQT